MPASPGPSADVVETAADAEGSSKPPLLVLDRVRAFLDEHFPLAEGSHADASAYTIEDGALSPALADPAQLVGWRGDPAVVLRLLN